MKKEDFVTQFEEILKDPTDLAKAGKFREAVMADYDAHDTLVTSTATLKENYTNLEAENKKLKETNLQLFMLSPAMSTAGKSPATDNPADEHIEPENTAPTVDDIVNGLLGTNTEKEK